RPEARVRRRFRPSMDVQREATLDASPGPVWTCPSALWGLLGIACAALLIAFLPALGKLYDTWMSREEYSFGILVPFISAFLVSQRRARLAAPAFEPSWLGVGVLFLGLAVGALAHTATASTLAQYAFLVALAGLVLAFAGRRAFGILAAPLAML